MRTDWRNVKLSKRRAGPVCRVAATAFFLAIPATSAAMLIAIAQGVAVAVARDDVRSPAIELPDILPASETLATAVQAGR